ncbi:MAG: type II toxin-antitoxin system RelE/ParE family toxin [Ardenticatenales bacterium]|nr:type II toxin-antitoxin system RelE/ParE family toxin [Ardenticatenales bacterium]
MSYQINYTREAIDELRALPARFRNRARSLIEGLVANPRPATAKELDDHPDYYRIRLEKWRIVYLVEDDVLVVSIIGIPEKTGPETYEELGLGRSPESDS